MIAENNYFLALNSLKKEMDLGRKKKVMEKAWSIILKPAVNVAAAFLGIAIGAKTKSPQAGKATTNILKNIS